LDDFDGVSHERQGREDNGLSMHGENEADLVI
jgi:hypothetical protein